MTKNFMEKYTKKALHSCFELIKGQRRKATSLTGKISGIAVFVAKISIRICYAIYRAVFICYQCHGVEPRSQNRFSSFDNRKPLRISQTRLVWVLSIKSRPSSTPFAKLNCNLTRLSRNAHDFLNALIYRRLSKYSQIWQPKIIIIHIPSRISL